MKKVTLEYPDGGKVVFQQSEGSRRWSVWIKEDEDSLRPMPYSADSESVIVHTREFVKGAL